MATLAELEKKVLSLQESVTKLKNDRDNLVKLASLLGLSWLVLAGWVWRETTQVAGLDTRIQQVSPQVEGLIEKVAKIEPMVKTATDAIDAASHEQIELIRSKSDPIVRDLIETHLGQKQIVGPYVLENENPGPVPLMRTSEAFCYLGGVFGQFPLGVASYTTA